MNHSNPVSDITLGQWLQTLESALATADVFLGHGTDNYWDEALHLTLPCLGISFEADRDILNRPLSVSEQSRLRALQDRRIHERIPVPYLTGEAWFAGMPFYVNPSVLIPRSPIAELIERGFYPWAHTPPERVLDLCCGGGCIGIACANYLPDTRVDLADISSDALVVAEDNIRRYGLEERVSCYQGDLFSALPEGRCYDLIVCNPPYVDAADMASLPAEYLHEPVLALAAGKDGLDLLRVILAQAADYLNEQGILIVEVGNSWQALEQAFPHLPFMWFEFERGGHGVFLLDRAQLLGKA